MMKSIKESIPKNITFHSDTCDKHTFWKDGEEYVKKVKMVVFKGQVLCPICESEKNTMQTEKEVYEIHKERLENPNRTIFLEESLVMDGTIVNARFNNYEADTEEAATNLALMKKAANDFLEGKKFNLWLQGKPGGGKSHLSYSLAHEVNNAGNYKVLFIDVSELIKEIQATFKNNKMHDSEQSIVRRLVEADLLILDDIGAEVGTVDTNKQASNFVSRVIFAIFNGRQGKCTISTTNLSGEQIKTIYDSKTFSRMFTNYRVLNFHNVKDRRFQALPF